MEKNSASNSSFLSEESFDSGEVSNEISFDELNNYYFSPGKITWKGRLNICSAGDVVDHTYLEKFKKLTDTIPCEFKMYSWNLDRFSKFITEIKEAKGYTDRAKARVNFLNWFKKVYWEGKLEGSLLDLMESCHRNFYNLPKDLEEAWTTKSIDLFRVYSLQGSLMVCFAIALGYSDFKSLKDIYHLPFFYDASLLDSLTFNTVSAISTEWEDKGNSLSFINNSSATANEKSLFKAHAEQAFKGREDLEESFFSMKNLAPVISRHHERIDGKGFPHSLNWSELSDLETLVIFVSHNYGSEEVDFDNENTHVYLNGRMNNEVCNEGTLSPRLESMIVGIFKNLDKELADLDLIGA
ncbi:MAG: hypothetical protein KC493_01055 [Bacteriovoracaceae bacterium]|nr:hypothetical protein [Bacteriovoracaceae bacterium]